MLIQFPPSLLNEYSLTLVDTKLKEVCFGGYFNIIEILY